MKWQATARRRVARLYRRLRSDMRWVVVSGSAGKTTTTKLVTAVLSCRAPALDASAVAQVNTWSRVVGSVLAARLRHRYGVLELSVGEIPKAMPLIRPRIVVMTNVAGDHRSAFGTLERTAHFKGETVRRLGAGDLAILNADDPLVWAMRHQTAARVVGFGRGPDAEIRADDVRAAWPDRLSLTVRVDGQAFPVRTRMAGDYAVVPVLAAFAVAREEGIAFEDAAAAIAAAEPVDGRMRPVETPDGITFIDNSWKAPLHSVEMMFDFLRGARAGRRVMVFGAISDFPGANSPRYRRVARQALEVADLVVFCGRWAASVSKLRDEVASGRLALFDNAVAAREGLRTLLQPGDLVVLTGSQRADHLDRLVLDRLQPVSCWRTDCRLMLRCVACEHLQVVPSARQAGV